MMYEDNNNYLIPGLMEMGQPPGRKPKPKKVGKVGKVGKVKATAITPADLVGVKVVSPTTAFLPQPRPTRPKLPKPPAPETGISLNTALMVGGLGLLLIMLLRPGRRA